MKIIVDKMPEYADECLFHDDVYLSPIRKCQFRRELIFSECDLSQGKQCPYLKEEKKDEK
jgi:hypothetical protein